MKYKQGEKMIVEITEVKENSYVLNRIGEVEPIEAKIRRQAAEITRLLAEKERLKAENEKMSVKIDAYELYGDQHKEEYNQAFNQGAETAWKLTRKITCQPINGGFKRSEFEEIFDESYISDIFEKYTYQEAAAKVAEWEKIKEKICVGDVVRFKENNSVEFCVTDILDDSFLYGINAEGGIYSDINIEFVEKTGRHIDMDSFLKQIGGDE